MKKLILLIALLCAAMPLLADEPWACANYNLLPEPVLVEPIALVLPNTSPFFGNGDEVPTLTVERLPFAGLIRWQGMACDEVWLPIGSEIRVINYSEYLENWLFVVRPDGYLDYRWAPR